MYSETDERYAIKSASPTSDRVDLDVYHVVTVAFLELAYASFVVRSMEGHTIFIRGET